MVKILVTSDNHGERAILEELINLYRNEVDYFLHCGDSELDISDPLWQKFQTVRGNCDYEPYLTHRVVETSVGNIFLTHGHLIGVKHDLQALKDLAKEENCFLACFGHSHVPTYKILEIPCLNPGSIRLPRGGYRQGTYAIIDWNGKDCFVNFYNRTHKDVTELV